MLNLHSKRLQVEKFVYQKGINVALYHAERSKTYINFKKQLQDALQAQIEYVTEYKDKLPVLLSLAKAADSPLQNQVSTLLSTVTLSNDIDLQAFLVWAASQGGQAAMDKLGINGIFGLKNQALIDYFGDYSNLTINSIDRYTKEWLAQKIQDGKDSGKTPFEIMQSIRDDGKGFTAIRAERIVLTETQRAMTKIELESYDKYGIETYVWRTSLDERVCPICLPLDGEEVKVGGVFSAGVDGPPAHVSCRCYTEAVIPDEWQPPEKVWMGN